MVRKIECDFPKIGKVYIYIKDKNLYEFTLRQFKNYILNTGKSDDLKDFMVIQTYNMKNIFFDEKILGRELKIEKNKIKFVKKNKTQKMEYVYKFDKKITINVNFKKNILYFIKKLIKSNYSMSHILFYQSVLYPVFSLYAVMDNYFLVHGSLLKVDESYIVLTGLDGVGKSSLSNELVKKGAEILADNFLLFNGRRFIGLNMPIRLDLQNDTNNNVIYKDNNLKEILYPKNEISEVKVNKVYFLSISKDLNIKKLKGFNHYNWCLINNGAGEILDGNLFNLPFYYENMLRENNFDNDMEYYMFSIPKDKIKKAAEELICQLNI